MSHRAVCPWGAWESRNWWRFKVSIAGWRCPMGAVGKELNPISQSIMEHLYCGCMLSSLQKCCHSEPIITRWALVHSGFRTIEPNNRWKKSVQLRKKVIFYFIITLYTAVQWRLEWWIRIDLTENNSYRVWDGMDGGISSNAATHQFSSWLSEACLMDLVGVSWFSSNASQSVYWTLSLNDLFIARKHNAKELLWFK